MSGAAGQGVWLTLPSEEPPPPPPGFSCDKAFSSNEGVWLSLGSVSTAPPPGPSTPPSSRGSRLKQKNATDWSAWVLLSQNDVEAALTAVT